MTYKKANCIDLISIQLRLKKDDWDGLTDFGFPGIQLSGYDFKDLLGVLGIETHHISKWCRNKEVQVGVESLDISISRPLVDWSDESNCPIQELAAEVLGPHLLAVRFKAQNKDQGPEDAWVEEYTYSGEFAVRWESESA